MKALQATCIVGAITFTGMIHQVGGNTPGATVPDAMPEAAVSAETPGRLRSPPPCRRHPPDLEQRLEQSLARCLGRFPDR